MEAQLTDWRDYLIRGSIWSLVARVVTVVGYMAFAGTAARVLPEDVFATFLVLSASIQIVAPLCQLGMEGTLERGLVGLDAGHSRKNLLLRATLLCCVTTAIVVPLAFGAASLGFPSALETLSVPERSGGWLLIGVWCCCYSIQALAAAAGRGCFDQSVGAVGNPGLSYLLAAPLLWGLKPIAETSADLSSFIVLAATFFATTTIALILAFRAAVRGENGGQSPRLPLPRLVSVPLMVTQLAQWALFLDIWVVAGLKDPNLTTNYGAAARAARLVSIPNAVTSPVMTPILGRMTVNREDRGLAARLQGITTMAFLGASILFTTYLLAGGTILRLIFGPGFDAAPVFLVVLSLGQLVNVWAGPAAGALLMHHREYELAAISVVSAGVALGASVFWGTAYGALGVAVCYAAGWGIQQISLVVAARFLADIVTRPTISGVRELCNGP